MTPEEITDRAIELIEADQRAESVRLLDDVHAALCRYVIFPSPEAGWATTLWVVATHGQQCWNCAPRLAILSPEMRCGKTRLLDMLEALAFAPIPTANISVAALVRVIEEDNPPTILLDEADTVFAPENAKYHEDLRGILNVGHQRGKPYLRWDMTSRKLERCPTFSMAALAAIGELPATVSDRAVVVRMRRRGPGEAVAPYRVRRDRPGLDELRDRVAGFLAAPEVVEALTEAEPEMPVEDRAADTYEPLIAVADLVGGDWPWRARSAALKLTLSEEENTQDRSLGQRLLADIRDTYSDWTVTFMTSADLVQALIKIEEAPWAGLGLTPQTLSTRLRPYGVKSRRNSAGTARGYRLEDFRDAFARYTPSEPVNASENGPEQGKQSDTQNPSDTLGRQSEMSRQADDQGKQPDPDDLTGSDGPLASNSDMFPIFDRIKSEGSME